MLHFITGDMMQADAEALVNTVNTVGIMGKGIALQFKEEYPYNNKIYVAACKAKELQPGRLLPVWDKSLHHGRKLIINFPTKTHWRQPSRYEYIEEGLVALRELIMKEGIKSIALPPLGCGNGGLDWNKVKPMIQDALGDMPAEIKVYEPNAAIKAELQKQETKKTVRLSPARAQLLYSLFAYESMGEDSSLFAANKLAYFLQRMGQPLRLQFSREMYGPFAIGVQKVLYDMNGIYLKGLEQQQAKAFEPLQLNYERWAEVNSYVQEALGQKERQRLDNLVRLIHGFHSELSLEILATTAFVLEEHPHYSIEQVMAAISEWSDRKGELFRQEYVEVAYAHLREYREWFG